MSDECIVLNKPFIGGYMDRSNQNEAHELINFFLADDGKHYIYCNPYGQNVRDADGKKVKYVLFTSALKNGCFYIEYIVSINGHLHNVSLSKKEIGTERANEEIEKAKRAIEEKLACNIDEVTYGGVPITKLFTDEIRVIPLTFEAKEILKLKTPICIRKDEVDYNFQRNFGYVTKNKNPKGYNLLSKIIESCDGDKVEHLTLDRFNIDGLNQKITPTFMDLISMFRQEECYTRILFKLLGCKKKFIPKFINHILKEENKEENIVGNSEQDEWQVECECVIDKVGRLDLYVHNSYYNIIIENKIDSGINYAGGNNQLTRYYEHFSVQDEKENIYLIFAPNEKLGLLTAEITGLKEDQHYRIVGYDKIYRFFNCNKDNYREFEYFANYADILEVFRRLSLSRKEESEERLIQNINRQKQQMKTRVNNS